MILRYVILGVLVLLALPTVMALAVAVLPVCKVPFRYNLRNLQARWITSLVTALAFTLVIGLLTIMLAFARGMDKLTETTGHAGNVLVLADGATDEAFSNLSDASIELLPSELQALVERDEADRPMFSKEVYVIVSQTLPNPVPGGRKRRFVQMRGLADMPLSARIHEIELAAGDWPSASGSREVTYTRDGGATKEALNEIVVGDGVAKTFGADLGKPSLMPGDVIDLGGHRWYVTGIMKATGSSFGSEVWGRDTHVGERFGRRNSYSSFVVRTKDAQLAEKGAELLQGFRSDRTFQAQTERSYYAKLQNTNDQFRLMFYIIALFMAVGGVLGVMNTMFAAISQRTKDIGVMRLLGYTRLQILCSFLLESLIIALVGGALGFGIGYLADGWTASSIISSGAGGGGKSIVLRLTVDQSVMLAAVLFTFYMGAVGGLIPSLSAMRLKPLESLR
ncbi:MAG: ABC transporter permease [Planctomycetes bacterium]|nr:ABC transporter permease [Planctomycetota bacterium]